MRKTSKKTDKKTIRKITKGKKVTYQRGTKWYSCKKQKLNNNIKISKQSSKNKKKNKKNMLGGALVSPGDLKNSTVIIYDKNKHYTGIEAVVQDYVPEENKYKLSITNVLPESEWIIPNFSREEFRIKESSNTLNQAQGNEKIYVLWVVNCQACKLSTNRKCNPEGIKKSYKYYNYVNNIYNKLYTKLSTIGTDLGVSVFSSFFLRAMETSKLITKGIMDHLSESRLSQKLKDKNISIINYCQEINQSKTSFSRIKDNVEILNKLIPTGLLISDNVLGINLTPNINIGISSPSKTLNLDEQDVLNQPESPQNVKTAEQPQLNEQDTVQNISPDETNDNIESQEITEPINPIPSQEDKDLEKFLDTADLLPAPLPTNDQINVSPNQENTQNIILEDSGTESLANESQLENSIFEPQSSKAKTDNNIPDLPDDVSSFRNKETEEIISSPDNINSIRGSLEQPTLNSKVVQNGGGFFQTIYNYLFGNSNGERKEYVNYQNDDYENWKNIILPRYLSSQDLNIVISHEWYIKYKVLNNNNAAFKVGNLDAFLLEYSFLDNQLDTVKLLDSQLQETVIPNESKPNDYLLKPTIYQGDNIEVIWDKITTDSLLTGDYKRKYSKCSII